MSATRTSLPPAPADASATECTVTLIGDGPRWTSPDRSFAIWAARDETDEPCVLRGPLAGCVGGERLRCRGRWREHPTHGWSFQVNEYASALPLTNDGVARWLATRVKGLGPAGATAIVEHFGMEEVFRVLDEDPARLREVRSARGTALPAPQVEALIAAWPRIRTVRGLESFLFSHGISAHLAGRLYQKYGEEVVEVITARPYAITEVRGIGFKTADGIARRLNVDRNDPERIRAGVRFVLEEAEGEGHVFLGLDELLRRCHEALAIDDDAAIVREAGILAGAGILTVEADPGDRRQRVYRTVTWRIECQLARRVRDLLIAPAAPLADVSAHERSIELLPPTGAPHRYEPTAEQWSAVDMAFRHRLALLTGGPGVGKTAVQEIVLASAEQAGLRVLMCAPTGKAARRMTELTGRHAQTIHKLLEWSPETGGFTRDESRPLEADLVICDEASMLSIDLADALLGAIGPKTHLLLVGDPDQLPPVGIGRVLGDLITAGLVPRTHLTRIFRQAARSMIVVNAHRINKGQMPHLSQADAGGDRVERDFFWMSRPTPERSAELVVDLIATRLPQGFALDPRRDIMVLAPMHKGALGLDVLNERIQAALNPSGQPLGLRGMRVGDRVIQNRNDYTRGREIMNGEIALITAYDAPRQVATLALDDGARVLELPVADMETFSLAWAISIHKSQGSQFTCVVTPVSTAHYVMLSRALTYTAVTRAERLCVLVGEPKALRMSVEKTDAKRRNSSLAARVQQPELSGELF